MGVIGDILGTPLGYLMKFCYDIINNYGLAIIVFTLLTKVVLFPISLLVQKNSIKMIKIKPKLDALKYRYVDDKDALLDAQHDLFKKEKYNPFAGTIPLLLQLPLIFWPNRCRLSAAKAYFAFFTRCDKRLYCKDAGDNHVDRAWLVAGACRH